MAGLEYTEKSGVSRRSLLGAAGAGLGGAVLLSPQTALGVVAPQLWSQPDHVGAPDVHGVHLQFGSDASREVVVSWFTPQSVARPRVLLGSAEDGFGRGTPADTVTYRDAASGTEVVVHHARLSGLRPDTEYMYAAIHKGTTPVIASFRRRDAPGDHLHRRQVQRRDGAVRRAHRGRHVHVGSSAAGRGADSLTLHWCGPVCSRCHPSRLGRCQSSPRTCWSRKASTVAYQTLAWLGLRIQWFSSGK